MRVSASELRARLSELLDGLAAGGPAISITKRGRVVARLVAAGDDDERPWLRVRGTGKWTGDPLAPAIDEDEVDALK